MEPAESAEPEWEELMGDAIRKKVLRPGGPSAPTPAPGDIVEYAYEVSHEGVEFAAKPSLQMRLGDGDDIPGIELAVRFMQVGEVAQVIVGHRFGYGLYPHPRSANSNGAEAGAVATIPLEADLSFRIELKRIVSSKGPEQMTTAELVEYGSFKKAVGNAYFMRGDMRKAAATYSHVLKTLEMEGLDTRQEGSPGAMMKQLVVACGNNLATCYSQMKDYIKAIEVTVAVLQLEPDNIKALYRAGQVSRLQGNHVEAKAALKHALQVDPGHDQVKAELARLLRAEEQYKEKERRIAKRMGGEMFGGSSSAKTDSSKSGAADTTHHSSENVEVEASQQQGSEEVKQLRWEWLLLVSALLAVLCALLVKAAQ